VWFLTVERFPFLPELYIRLAFQHVSAFRAEEITLTVKTGVIKLSEYINELIGFRIDVRGYFSVIGHISLLILQNSYVIHH